MKQVVTETWYSENNVQFSTSESFDKDLIGKKEFQEVITKTDKVKIIKYWVRVPDTFVGTKEKKQKVDRNKLMSEKRQLACRTRIESTQERIAKYRKMVESGKVLFGCDRDDWLNSN